MDLSSRHTNSNKHRFARRFRTVAATAVLIFVWLSMTGCMSVEATGERHIGLIDENREIEIGKESHRQIVASIGLYEDADLREYVRLLGQRVAQTTERPDLPWSFAVLDDAAINAFAVPGGYVYLTRGILVHLENEAQVLGILGHEIGHITARHSVIRLSRGMLAQLGMDIATGVKTEFERFAPLAGPGLQLLFLKCSGDD